MSVTLEGVYQRRGLQSPEMFCCPDGLKIYRSRMLATYYRPLMLPLKKASRPRNPHDVNQSMHLPGILFHHRTSRRAPSRYPSKSLIVLGPGGWL